VLLPRSKASDKLWGLAFARLDIRSVGTCRRPAAQVFTCHSKGKTRGSVRMAQPLALDSAPAGQGAGWRKGQDLIDALPYVDRLTPEEKQRVDRLIQEEVSRIHTLAAPRLSCFCSGRRAMTVLTSSASCCTVQMRNSTQRPAAYLKDLPPAYELKLEVSKVLACNAL
jgi:Breast carcinoma amplified sequence 2 (BCAS2)